VDLASLAKNGADTVIRKNIKNITGSEKELGISGCHEAVLPYYPAGRRWFLWVSDLVRPFVSKQSSLTSVIAFKSYSLRAEAYQFSKEENG
jgi:hypothetical protein